MGSISRKGLMNKQAGELWLAENAKREGVVTTPSGLQYEVITVGVGRTPNATDVVRVHYEGKHIDGRVFDSSYKRHQPATFALHQVIAGWTEGLQLMSEGAKYRFYLPHELAYGRAGAGTLIPPFSALIFEVELLQVC